MTLVPGHAYYLEGLRLEMWDIGHPKFGKPYAIAGRYLGSVAGNRTWHVFEIWIDFEEQGAILMCQQDLDTVKVARIANAF